MKPEYHINDKLLCIENFDTNAHTLLYKKNKYYTITNISHISHDNSHDKIFEIFNKHAPLYFSLTNNIYNIKKYFLSVTEQRKLKLDKISKL